MSSYYKQLVTVVEDYLGPAADRFVTRQIDFHLSKKTQDLSKADLSKLADSIPIALGLLTKDKELIKKASIEISKIN